MLGDPLPRRTEPVGQLRDGACLAIDEARDELQPGRVAERGKDRGRVGSARQRRDAPQLAT